MIACLGSGLLALLWIAWLMQAILSAIQVNKLSREFLHKRRANFKAHQPSAAVIVPFKGLELDLSACVRSFCNQEYKQYRILFVVESQDDPVYTALQNEIENYPHRPAKILIAGTAGHDQGQKVHNQLVAIDALDDRDRVWIFADSDSVPGRNWLSEMVGPLRHENIGMTTGYRWLVPRGIDGNKPTLAAQFGSVINSSIACSYRRNRLSHAWGGSMAIRSDAARKGNLKSRLVGALTDDYQFSALCHDLGKRLYFVPHCLVATPTSFDWPSLFNFARRQYLITRIYAPRLFITALLCTSLYVAGVLAAWTALVHGVVFHFQSDNWIWPALVLIHVFLANQVRGYYRRLVVERTFGPHILEALEPSLNIDQWYTQYWMALHCLMILLASFGRTITWRGIRYRLLGPQHVQRLNSGDTSTSANCV